MGRRKKGEHLLSHTGHALSRHTAFVFQLDPNQELEKRLHQHAGTARFAFNYQLGRVVENLTAREAEKEAGLSKEEMTPSLSWSAESFINQMTAHKNGTSEDTPVQEDGSRGLPWRVSVSTDVFETASVDAAQALKNWKESKAGKRPGLKVGWPQFKAKHHNTPSFRLRNREKPGETGNIRVAGPKFLLLPSLGQVRIHGCTRRVRRMVNTGRFHIFSATITFKKGKWWISSNGVAAEFHHSRRSPRERHPHHTGVDRGITNAAVVADTQGEVLHAALGVRALEDAQVKLRRASKAFSRTKKGSNGRVKAKAALTKLHAKVAYLRQDAAHKLSHALVTTLRSMTMETLSVQNMMQLKTLARHVADAGMGQLGQFITYKAAWYGMGLDLADRWYPSTQLCSSCGRRQEMPLAVRTYVCGERGDSPGCGLVLDRDVNAAINLALWPAREETWRESERVRRTVDRPTGMPAKAANSQAPKRIIASSP